MKKCLICNRNKSNFICHFCSEDPFLIEEYRRKVAVKKDYLLLKKLYSSNYAEISDLNSKEFWDEKLERVQVLKEQDGMTKARICGVLSLLPKRAQKVLDIGTGYGFIEEVFHKKKPNLDVFGFDISSQAVKSLNKRFKGDFRVGSIYKIPFKDSLKFDAILALEVLEHIPPSKIFDVLKSIRSYLNKNGAFIVSVPVNENLRTMGTNPSGHLREYSLNLLKAELEIAGFKVDSYREFSSFKNFYTLKDFIKRHIFKKRWNSNDILVKATII